MPTGSMAYVIPEWTSPMLLLQPLDLKIFYPILQLMLILLRSLWDLGSGKLLLVHVSPLKLTRYFFRSQSNKLVSTVIRCCPILIRTDLFQHLKGLHIQPGMSAPTDNMAFRLIPITAFITAGEFVDPLVFMVFKDGNMKSKDGFPPLPTGIIEVLFKLCRKYMFFIYHVVRN